MNAGPNTIGRQIRKPPTRCSWCHGARVTAIKDRRLGAFGVRSACADCYQLHEGRPWTGALPAPKHQPYTPPKPGPAALPPVDREMKPARFSVLQRAAVGAAADLSALPTGRALGTQLGGMRSLGWLDDGDRITETGRAIYEAQIVIRAEWARRRKTNPRKLRDASSAPAPAPAIKPAPKAKSKRVHKEQAPRFGPARWALLTAAATGRRAEWLAAYKLRSASTLVRHMIAAGWLKQGGAITLEGFLVFTTELDRRARLASRQEVAK